MIRADGSTYTIDGRGKQHVEQTIQGDKRYRAKAWFPTGNGKDVIRVYVPDLESSQLAAIAATADQWVQHVHELGSCTTCDTRAVDR